MLSEFIAQAAKEMDFELEIFKGALKVRGRVLSPAEIDRSSVASAKLLQSMATQQHTQSKDLQERLKQGDEQAIKESMTMLNRIDPKKMEDITRLEDSLLRNSIKEASRDGEIWEPLELVMMEHHEDAEKGKLWVGRISKEDRKSLLSKMMRGHMEAVERLSTFRR